MGITYTTEYNRVRNKRDLGNTSLEDALTQAASDVKYRMYDTISLTLTDGTVISNDELLYLIIYYGGFPRYNYRPNQSEILQTIRRLRDQKRKNIGIMYKTEYNGVQRKHHFVGTCLIDVLRKVAEDIGMRAYDSVSLTLEDSGMVITNDELERITKSNMGFPTGLERSEATILSDIKQLQEQKRKERSKQSEDQQRLKQARVTVQTMIASGQIRTPVISSWFELNPTEMAIEDQKKWAIVEYHLDGKLSFKFYIDGRDQILSARSREEAEEVMAKLISGVIERR